MNINSVSRFLAGSLVSSLLAAVAYADDTEIFFNSQDAEIQPNLLFILDNSGSMDSTVTTSTNAYDPATTYEGDYSNDYIHYYKWGSRHTIAKSVLECDDITTSGALDRSGYLLSYRMSYFYRGSWREFGRVDVNNSKTECEADNDLNISWPDYREVDVYSANYLNWYFNYRESVTKTRLKIMQEVATALAGSLSRVNIGLMAFNTDDVSEGGRVLVPVGDVAENRDAFTTAVNALDHETNTPLSETLFGAMRYFGGGAPFLDSTPVPGTVDADGNYISPISNSCQANYTILLTDGEPTQDANHEDAMESVVGTCSGNCLDEVAGYMQNNDIHTGVGGLDGDQIVTTYTVGFQSDQTLLNDAATAGGGTYYTADSAEELQSAFESIVRSVLAVNTTFVAPGIAVNTFNRLNHLDSLYFSVFQPDVAPRWDGNLKRYRLGSDGKIYDVNGLDAVNEATGFFKEEAKSWWSPVIDGPEVSVGGAASQHKDTNSLRNIYTYTGSTLDLTDASNAVSVGNKANLPMAMFGATTEAEHERLINWTRGMDVDDLDLDGSFTDSRKFIADPLHSVPHLVIYGGDTNSPDTTVFFGDNQGFIHAINGDTGATYFSFIPTDLLDNQATLLENSTSVTERVYGMDGSIASWQIDDNYDGQIVEADGDRLYIYGGMRRGGRSYYALDVTTRTSPKFLWSLTGGDTGAFAYLGQTWSKPVKTKVKINNSVEDVIIISGGYDPSQDTATSRATDDVGTAVYMLDANDGSLLWWAGPTGSGATLELAAMNYSIPATPKVLDITGNGWADQIYVGDMGGQVWRFDIHNEEQASSLVTGGVIAELAGDTEASNRRFYHSPDLFGLKYNGKRYLGLVIGSGYQAHPLNTTVEDRIYMLRIADVTGPPLESDELDAPVDYASVKVTEAQLFDTTANLIDEGTTAEQQTARESLAAAKGWYIRLTRAGEKVLSSSQTVNGQIFITSYEPTAVTEDCTPRAGTARFYHLTAEDGTAVVNYDGVGEEDALTAEDREVELNTLGLPPDPQRMRVDGKDIICVGAECRTVETVTGVVQTYWHEE